MANVGEGRRRRDGKLLGSRQRHCRKKGKDLYLDFARYAMHLLI
jgi:hypothetical protein